MSLFFAFDPTKLKKVLKIGQLLKEISKFRKIFGHVEPFSPFCLGVAIPRAATSSSFGLQSESDGVWTSQ